MNIFKSNSLNYKQNIVILTTSDNDLSSFELTEDEKNYVRSEFDHKNYQVALNRYSNWLIIQSFDGSKAANQIKENLRKAGHSICSFAKKHKISELSMGSAVDNSTYILALAEGLALSNYQFLNYFSDAAEKRNSLTELAICAENISDSEIEKLNVLTQAVCIARDLVNEPVSTLTAQRLADEIKQVSAKSGFTVNVLQKAEIENLKMGGLLAVNQGSTQPPTFSILEWKPDNAKNSKPIVLVGKGLVYDTGGHSLKPTPDSMDYMKCDMAGAAAVTGALYAVAKCKLPLHIIGLVPSTDNRISADAYSPGDIITISDGTTVEVLNTDAEGRLVLADALSYAKQYNPELVFTIATLTGAAHRAIGTQGMVGMGNVSAKTQAKIEEAGYNVHERVAVFPFWDEYADSLKSDIADLKNIGGELAGAITAGKFLEHFTNYPFFHLDIAGVAFLKKGGNYRGTGGTGSGVRLFFEFLENYNK